MPRLLALLAALTALAGVAQAQPDFDGLLIRPDPDRVDPGDTFSFSLAVRNVGTEDAPATEIGFYLSADRFLSDDDVLLGRRDVPALDAQKDVRLSVTLTTPDVPRGGYFVLGVADDPDRVDERDETNNVSSGGLTVGGSSDGPDLAFNGAELEDRTAAPGDRVSVEYTIANRGRTDVEDFEVGYYLAPISRPPSEWILLERETLGGLDADDDEDESEQVTIPMNVSPGEYGFTLVADDRNAVEEADETNNVLGVSRITITGGTATANDPAGARLSLQTSPNPTSSAVRLSFEVREGGPIRLAVFDALGREIAVAADYAATPGSHAVNFDVSALPPGLYVARLVTPSGVATATLTVSR